jgi:hypothetical protein
MFQDIYLSTAPLLDSAVRYHSIIETAEPKKSEVAKDCTEQIIVDHSFDSTS